VKNEGYLEAQFKSHPTDGQWMTLVEYSAESGISLSTLRRCIKDGRVRFKQEDGKYWIWGDRKKAAFAASSKKSPEYSARLEDWAMEVEALKLEVRHLQEEIAELKTWIAFSDREQHHGDSRKEFRKGRS
jgi:hypothetical protein